MRGQTRNVLRRVRITPEIVVRLCVQEDLRLLEWQGLFWEHRAIIEHTFQEQGRGTALMLVADLNSFPVGQIWIDLWRKRAESTGILWALRIFPFLRRLGLGTALMNAAEEALRDRGFCWAELGVEKTNPDAERLYEMLGYRRVTQRVDTFKYTTPNGETRSATVDQWILRKPLEIRESVEDEHAPKTSRTLGP